MPAMMTVVVTFKCELPSAEMRCIYCLNSTWINIVTHAVKVLQCCRHVDYILREAYETQSFSRLT